MSDSPPPGPAKADPPAAAEVPPAETPPQEADESWGGFFGFLAQRLFVYFALYALSIGPFYWQWYKAQFVGGSSLLAAFYLPLVMLAEWVPPFGEWMDWYVNLWIA